MAGPYSIPITVAEIVLPGRKWRAYHIMNSRGATKSLGGTLFDTRDIVRDKLAENAP
jgi:hypothetical protein